MSERWIVIPNWERFQHYSDRRPPWIKAYLELLDDEDYMALPLGTRGLLHGLWLSYASHRGVLSMSGASRELVRSGSDARYVRRHLESLSDAGFIEVCASKPLPFRYSRVRERERDRTISLRDQRRTNEPTPGSEWARQREKELKAEEQERGNGWIDNLSSYTGCRTVRGEHSISHVYDPLGTEPPPAMWSYPRPTRAEIKRALEEQSLAF